MPVDALTAIANVYVGEHPLKGVRVRTNAVSDYPLPILEKLGCVLGFIEDRRGVAGGQLERQ
jgi:hypothetical protein